ncbi:hypothetical protein [Bacillus sp. CGMCC 1.16541]|uniref:hypothetical protein n=1 Tax=Bacillus sp. CGMCC 1.16541 TaxID=2185143 RepID=UPI0013A59392|nr:hypothetical protein [Bacillus sp. CGMCC 1.16541]
MEITSRKRGVLVKKKIVFASALGLLLLTGCQESTIQYQGERMPVSEVEEIIADQLEVENPDMDLEVSIFEESDD